MPEAHYYAEEIVGAVRTVIRETVFMPTLEWLETNPIERVTEYHDQMLGVIGVHALETKDAALARRIRLLRLEKGHTLALRDSARFKLAHEFKKAGEIDRAIQLLSEITHEGMEEGSKHLIAKWQAEMEGR